MKKRILSLRIRRFIGISLTMLFIFQQAYGQERSPGKNFKPLATYLPERINLSGFSATSTPTGYFQNCPQCQIPPNTDAAIKDYVIDASTGANGGNLNFKKGQRIRIVIKNMNPFLFKYDIKIEEKVVAETAIAAFLPLLGDFVGGLIPAPPGTDEVKEKADDTKAKKSLNRAPMARAGCDTSAVIAFDLLTETQGELEELRRTVDAKFKSMSESSKEIQRKYEERKESLENPQAVCETLCATAKDLIEDINKYNSSTNPARFDPDFADEIARLRFKAKEQLIRISDFESRFPTCEQTLVAIYREHAKEIATTITDRFEQGFAEIKKRKENLDSVSKSVSAVLKSPNSFHQEHFRGPFRVATDVTITVGRKPEKQEKFDEFVKSELNFGGGPRFALAGGVVVSLLDKDEFQQVQGFARDREGNPEGDQALTPVIGLKQGSDTRISPIAVLHTRLVGLDQIDGGFHISLGVTAKNDNKGTDVEFLIGPSFSFAEERFFITVGGYADKVQELEGELFVGARVPEGLTEPPVRKDYKWNVGFALTYRIR